MEALLDVTGAAKLLTISEPFLRRLVQTGRIPHVRVHRLVRFRAEDLAAFVEACRVETTEDLE